MDILAIYPSFLKVIIDLKSWESPEETVNLISSLYMKMPKLRTSALVTSFFPQLLYKLRFNIVYLQLRLLCLIDQVHGS